MYWEVAQCAFQLIFGISLVVSSVVLLVKSKKRAKVRRCPSLEYFKARYQAKSWLEAKKDDGKTRMETILLNVRLVTSYSGIVTNLGQIITIK